MSVGDIEWLSSRTHEPRRPRIHRLREPEVEHLHRAVTADLDVGGLQIAMDDALLVRRFERLGDLSGDRQRLVDRDRAVGDPLGQIVALDQFHHEGVVARGFLDRIDGGDVGMIQRRERLRLALEPRQALEIGRERVGKDLDGDLATERRVRRSVHLPHAPFADRRSNFVDAEVCAGCEGQG